MCGVNIHLWDQDILETSVQFDGYQNHTNLQIVIAIQNTQRQEEKFILSTIRCKMTEILTQAGNDQTTNLHIRTCKANWDGL